MDRDTIHTNGEKLKVQRVILAGGEKLDRWLREGHKVWLIVSSGIAILKIKDQELVLRPNDRITIEEIESYTVNNRETGSLCFIETEFDDRE